MNMRNCTRGISYVFSVFCLATDVIFALTTCGRPEFNTITYDGPLIRAAVGTEATVKCGPRYHQKSFTITCLKSGMWSKPTGECKIGRCPPLQNPVNGEVLSSNNTYQSIACVRCHEGYDYSKPNSTKRVCEANQEWSGEEGTCKETECPPLQDIYNGYVSVPGVGHFKDVCRLLCKDGYSIDGFSLTICQANGTWMPNLGTCGKLESNSTVFIKTHEVVYLILLAGLITSLPLAGIYCHVHQRGLCSKSKEPSAETNAETIDSLLSGHQEEQRL